MDQAAGDSAGGSSATGANAGDSEPGGGADSSGSASAGGSGNRAGSGAGARTSAERTTILNDELERKTGEFDAMILAEQEAQRQAARQQTPGRATTTAGSERGPDDYIGGEMDAGDNSTGGGMGGGSASSSETGIPQNTAKYPPPAGIPSGNDDDVVARQLREAAMREPDPKLREKLWDEYRKYKGIGT